MAVVVTGAAGFLGRALVAALAADGVPVVAVDRRPGAGWSADLPPADHPGRGSGAVTALRADLLAGDPAVQAALREADAVFHLAGRPGVRDTGPAAEAARVRDNVAATAAVLAAVPPATPLVVTSSSSVYGGAAGRPSREADPLRPLGGYARSKAAVEALCAARGGAVTVLRPFTVAGEGQRPDMALARWIAAARAGRPLRVLGSPARTRDVTDVRDLVRALRLAAERDVRGVLNVGTGRPRTLAELAAAVCRALGAPAELVLEPAVAVEPAASWADTTLLRRRLGFVPVTELDELVARQAAAGSPAGSTGSAGSAGSPAAAPIPVLAAR
ncbi:MAG: NAD-dependent epimerase/dehydratase family protein [Mycobacteriales bacterium]